MTNGKHRESHSSVANPDFAMVGRMIAKSIPALLIFITISCAFAWSQDSLANSREQRTGPTFRILLDKGFPPASGNGADEHGYEYLLAFGSVARAWWHPSLHLYVTYDEYFYYRGWLSSERKYWSLVGVYPTVRLFSFILVGYGCSFGNRYDEQWTPYAYPVPSHTITKGWSEQWSAFAGIDVNVYVAYDFYFAVGVLVKNPLSSASIGIAKTF
jgi:hypothetical protein